MKYTKDSLVLGSSVLIVGLVIGVGMGMLLAPYSGARIRRRLRGVAEDWLEDTVERLDDLVVQGQQLIASGFRKVST
jgi:gas vesicle protein